MQLAQKAWAREFSTGRPFRLGKTAWKGLRETIENACSGKKQAVAVG
jgi:hypothetical protein